MRYIKYFKPGSKAVPDGWVELKGRLGEKRTPAGTMKAYAPEDFALVYNRFVQKRFGEEPVWGNIANGVKNAANAITSMELGISAFHAGTMMMAQMSSNMARGIGQIASGKIAKGTGTMLRSPNPFGAIRDMVGPGKKLQEQFLGVSDHGPLFKRIADLGEKANIRVTGRQDIYKSSAMADFWTSWKRGTLGNEGRAFLRDLKDRKLVSVAGKALGGIGRAMDTIAHPMFDKMIPQMKSAVFYKDTAAWLEAHPGATEAESVAAARKIWDSVDNRFGEMVLDNVFWNQTMKGSLQVALRAMSWNLGIIRELGGGIGETVAGAARLKQGKGTQVTTGQGAAPRSNEPPSNRAAYLLAFPIMYAIYNSVMTYLHTGEGPKELRDLVSYRTGGQSPMGGDERVFLPGHTSEILQTAHAPLHEAGNKIASFFTLVKDIATNQDHRDLPIYEGSEFAQSHGADGWMKAMLGHIAQKFESMTLKNMLKGPNKDSAISLPERALGVRPAPSWFTDPEKTKALEERRKIMDEKRKHRSDYRLENR